MSVPKISQCKVVVRAQFYPWIPLSSVFRFIFCAIKSCPLSVSNSVLRRDSIPSDLEVGKFCRDWPRSFRGTGWARVVTASHARNGWALNVPPTFTTTPHFRGSTPQIVLGILCFCIQGSLGTVKDSRRSFLTTRLRTPPCAYTHGDADRVFKT